MAAELDVFDMWQTTMSVCNVQQGGQIRPDTDFTNWFNAANDEIFRRKCAKFELGQLVTDELAPFHSVAICPVVNGYVAMPADYEYLADMRILRPITEYPCKPIGKLPIIDGSGKSVKFTDPDYAKMVQQYASMGIVEKTVTIIDTQKWASCLDHPRKGPTMDQPKATQNENGFKIAPVVIQAVVLDYFHTPRRAVFAYTVVNDIAIYNAGGSTQVEWTSILKDEFLAEMEKRYAGAVGDMGKYQQADNNKRQLV